MLESRRKLFMSEKEKKEEMILKQRAELAIKKGTAELETVVEKEIGNEVLATLDKELNKLLVEEVHETAVHLTLPIARKNIGNPATPTNATKGTASSAGKQAATGSKVSSGEKKKGGGSVTDDGSVAGSVKEDPAGAPTVPYPTVDIADLFDMENIDASADFDNFHKENAQKSKPNEEEEKKSNEFAAELLYIMRTSMSFA